MKPIEVQDDVLLFESRKSVPNYKLRVPKKDVQREALFCALRWSYGLSSLSCGYGLGLSIHTIHTFKK